jgi:hypothetical protein
VVRPTWLPAIGRRELAVFAVLVVLLLAPWPRLGRAFVAFFGAYGNVLVGALDTGDAAPPRFGPPQPGEVGAADGGEWAVILRSGDRALPLDTRIIGYTPLAIFLALALATPVPRRRKAIILSGGLAFLLARLAFAVMAPLGSTRLGLAAALWTVLIASPVMSYAAPLAVWWVAFALTTPKAVATSRGPWRRGGKLTSTTPLTRPRQVRRLRASATMSNGL